MAPTPVAPASALLQLSLDELGVVGLAISDPLRPSVAGAFAAACLTLQAAMVAPLARLQPQHVQAKALAARMGMTCAAMREATMLDWCDRGLTATDMGTLGMVMSLGWIAGAHSVPICVLRAPMDTVWMAFTTETRTTWLAADPVLLAIPCLGIENL